MKERLETRVVRLNQKPTKRVGTSKSSLEQMSKGRRLRWRLFRPTPTTATEPWSIQRRFDRGLVMAKRNVRVDALEHARDSNRATAYEVIPSEDTQI